MIRGLLAALLVVLGACAATPAEPATVASAPSSPPPAVAAQDFDRDAPPRVETATFALELTAPASADVGSPAPVSLSIEGRGGYHINREYPLRIALGSSEGTVLAQSTLALADARELSDELARFATEARWSVPGRHWLAARVQFAVCTPDTCVPREESLAIALDVTTKEHINTGAF